MCTIITCMMALPLCGQLVSYTHPRAAIGFMASPDWEEELLDDQGLVYEVTNPNHNMRVSLSFMPECRNPKKQMMQLSGLRGMMADGRPSDTILNGKQAFMLKGSCLNGRLPHFRLILGIPEDGGLYLLEICCPEECLANHQELVRSVLNTLTVGARSPHS